MPRPVSEIKRQIEQLEQAAQALRKEVSDLHDDLLLSLSEPLSFSQIMTRTGLRADDLRERLTQLYASGQIERWDLPRFVRSDLNANEKKSLLRQVLAESPIRQQGGEKLTGLTRGQVSGVLIELQKRGAVERLGSAKGDPWFVARGTQPPPPPGDTEPAPTPTPTRRSRRSTRTRRPSP
jgi:predicted Rossmann fold nucleotide-binding protein DprA/Smf involved in DNA uptake